MWWLWFPLLSPPSSIAASCIFWSPLSSCVNLTGVCSYISWPEFNVMSLCAKGYSHFEKESRHWDLRHLFLYCLNISKWCLVESIHQIVFKNMLLKCSNWGQKGDKYMFQSSCKRNTENSLSVLLQPHLWCHSLGSLCNDLTPWAHVSVVEVSIFHQALFIYFLKAEVRRNLFVHRAILNSRMQS